VDLTDNDPIAPAREDGFGVRRLLVDSSLGPVERLELTPSLASWGSEQAIRARAAYLSNAFGDEFGRVLRIERAGENLAIISALADGIPLGDILAALEFRTVTLAPDELVELAASVIEAVAQFHERMSTRAHGALTPAHIIVQLDGTSKLCGAVFAEALQALEHNREALWKEFGLALPSSASLPRFDQRGDVTQLGAIVLAIALRRTLRRDEYPRGAADLVPTVSLSVDITQRARIRQWLQDTLQLHGRVVFSSALDAAQAFAEIVPDRRPDSPAARTVQTALSQMLGGTAANVRPHLRAS